MVCWRDHSAGASRSRVTPMPRGSRPAIAAPTRSGARNASEMVILTCRTLHRSRLAMLSAFAFASVRSSLSQRRPRAIDATRSARVSNRMGRACCGGVPAGNGLARLELAHLCDDTLFTQVGHELVHDAKPLVAAKNGPDSLSFLFIDGDLAIPGVIAERGHAADPQPLALGGGNLVADALRG